jgi:hypothetical protein
MPWTPVTGTMNDDGGRAVLPRREAGMAETVWERLREYAATQTGVFTSQEAISWFNRHYPGTNARTLRTHIRNASGNVENRSWAQDREPFLVRVGWGEFRRATPEEVARWRETRGDAADEQRGAGARHQGEAVRHASPGESDRLVFEWFSEENTQRLLVEWLRAEGWTIVRTANTATHEHGIDVVAERAGEHIGIEVKGFPSRFYAAGPMRGQVKTTRPLAQAPKWFAHALVPAMRLRTAEPGWRSVICFPDFQVYRDLHAQTAVSLRVAGIETWLVSEAGEVDTDL